MNDTAQSICKRNLDTELEQDRSLGLGAKVADGHSEH